MEASTHDLRFKYKFEFEFKGEKVVCDCEDYGLVINFGLHSSFVSETGYRSEWVYKHYFADRDLSLTEENLFETAKKVFEHRCKAYVKENPKMHIQKALQAQLSLF